MKFHLTGHCPVSCSTTHLLSKVALRKRDFKLSFPHRVPSLPSISPSQELWRGHGTLYSLRVDRLVCKRHNTNIDILAYGLDHFME